MSQELLARWLRLPPGTWPPDHYTLLGLAPGEADPERIERHVQLRMEWLRCYQLAHPDLATEAMNRLAQAFDCLRHPASKQAYDAQLQLPSQVATAMPNQPLTGGAVELLTGELAEPVGAAVRTPETLAARPKKDTWKPEDVTVSEPLDEAVAPPPPAVGPDDPALEAARSAPARRGLGTKRSLYHRISRTRRLIRAWVEAGRYLGDPHYRLGQRTEAIDLVRQLTIIRYQLQDYPLLLGQAGQPGYLVIALARQPEIVKTFQGLSASQRNGYVRDWQAGLALLAAYRLFLREELWKLRRQTRLARLARTVGTFVSEHTGWWLFLLALLTINLAWPAVGNYWFLELLALLGAGTLLWFWKSLGRQPSLHRIRRQPAK